MVYQAGDEQEDPDPGTSRPEPDDLLESVYEALDRPDIVEGLPSIPKEMRLELAHLVAEVVSDAKSLLSALEEAQTADLPDRPPAHPGPKHRRAFDARFKVDDYVGGYGEIAANAITMLDNGSEAFTKLVAEEAKHRAEMRDSTASSNAHYRAQVERARTEILRRSPDMGKDDVDMIDTQSAAIDAAFRQSDQIDEIIADIWQVIVETHTATHEMALQKILQMTRALKRSPKRERIMQGAIEFVVVVVGLTLLAGLLLDRLDARLAGSAVVGTLLLVGVERFVVAGWLDRWRGRRRMRRLEGAVQDCLSIHCVLIQEAAVAILTESRHEESRKRWEEERIDFEQSGGFWADMGLSPPPLE